MRLRTAIAAGALALAPALAWAAQPWLVRIDGHAVPMQHSTRLVHTAAGTARISSWSWQGPQGAAQVVVERGPGAAPPAWALHQLQMADLQMQAMQQQMRQLDRLMLSAPWAPPAVLSTAWLPPAVWAAPQRTRVLLLVPAPVLPHGALRAAAHAPQVPHKVPGLAI